MSNKKPDAQSADDDRTMAIKRKHAINSFIVSTLLYTILVMFIPLQFILLVCIYMAYGTARLQSECIKQGFSYSDLGVEFKQCIQQCLMVLAWPIAIKSIREFGEKRAAAQQQNS